MAQDETLAYKIIRDLPSVCITQHLCTIRDIYNKEKGKTKSLSPWIIPHFILIIDSYTFKVHIYFRLVIIIF